MPSPMSRRSTLGEEALHVSPPTEKLRFLRSPIHPEDAVGDGAETTGALPPGLTRPSNPPEVERMGYRYAPDDFPLLRRNEDATNLEVFYDLFLACLNLFNRNQQMETINGLSAYAGFFSLLWTTWFLTGAYDVRFVTDSVFERCCRAVHLGVLVGFVTVSPNFNLARQDARVFQTFSLILMVSRLCLGLEYASILLQAWRYRKTRWQLATMAGLNFFNGFIYLGVSFRFSPDSPRLFISWYGVCAVEIVTVMFIAVTYPILSFQGTPLIRRLSLLTLIIFGEGITVACSNITQIIDAEGGSAWTSSTIGTVTACISITYLAFMLYFDSVSRMQLPPWRQLAWTILHFPLHLALTLFTEGCAQFIVFWKITEIEQTTIQAWSILMSEALESPAADFSRPFRVWIDDYFNTKPPHYLLYRWTLNDTLDELSEFDRPSRDALRDAYQSGDLVRINETAMADPAIAQVLQGWSAMILMVINIASSELGLDYYQDELQDQGIEGAESSLVLGTLETETNVTYRAFFRMRVVFQYTFACGGAVIGLLAVLSVVGRTERWTRWSVARAGIGVIVAIGIAMVAGLSQVGQDIPLALFLSTPLVLPPLAILFFLLLVLHHLPEGPLSRCLSLRRWRGSGKSTGGSAGGKPSRGPDEAHGSGSDGDVESANTVEDAQDDDMGTREVEGGRPPGEATARTEQGDHCRG